MVKEVKKVKEIDALKYGASKESFAMFEREPLSEEAHKKIQEYIEEVNNKIRESFGVPNHILNKTK